MNTSQYGRHGDNYTAHVQKGELVVPKQILKDRPDIKQEIYREIEKYGVKGHRYVVGNKSNSINPYTGQPEFFLKKIVKGIKQALPVIAGAAGAYFLGPMGASLGAGLGSAIRGDNPANIATNALMGYGLGSLTSGTLAARGASFGKLGGAPTIQAGNMAQLQAQRQLQEAGIAEQLKAGFKGMPLAAKSALGLGALGLLAQEDEKDSDKTPFPEPGQYGQLSTDPGRVTFYDRSTGRYGSASPTLPPIATVAEGGAMDINNFPRKTGQIDGPGTEKSDDIPAMLSDGEFVMTAQAVRGLGALNGANKDDKLEQRRKGAKMMYEMMDKFESKVA